MMKIGSCEFVHLLMLLEIEGKWEVAAVSSMDV
jgi:hypothetical protein